MFNGLIWPNLSMYSIGRTARTVLSSKLSTVCHSSIFSYWLLVNKFAAMFCARNWTIFINILGTLLVLNGRIGHCDVHTHGSREVLSSNRDFISSCLRNQWAVWLMSFLIFQMISCSISCCMRKPPSCQPITQSCSNTRHPAMAH